MVPFEYLPRLPKKTVCAPGSVARLPELLEHRGAPLLLVSDRGLARLGLPAAVAQRLESAGFAVTSFTELAGEPTLADLEACRTLAEERGAAVVVGLGGGSAMDTAKGVAALAGSGRATEAVVGTELLPGRSLELALVPTTAGTGAEATPNALFIDAARRRKVAIVSRFLLPDLALLDPELTQGLPPSVTASTGLDALTHAVESFISRRANPVSQAFSLEAVRLLAASLETAVQRGSDLEARQATLVGSYLGGAALTIAGTGAVHALAYSLGSRGVAHGVANGLLLPHVMRFNAQSCPAQIDILSATVGGDFLAWVQALVDRLPFPKHLSELGIAESEIPAMAEESLEQTRLLQNNPRAWTALAARDILLAVR
ncbi:MAG: iron-containing alcohol dehydrogenase [Chitinophagales bacterium]